MPRPKDVHLNTAGDIEIGHNGDIACSYDDDVTVEGVIFRLKTYTGDYELEPRCGAGLEDFIGKPNTIDTGEQIKERVRIALTHDRFIDSNALTVDVAPLSHNEVFVSVTVVGSRGTFTVLSSLDLLTGRIKVVAQ